MTDVELLFFDGCPSWRTTWDELGQLLSELGVDASVHLRTVTTLDDSERWRFAGSPTIRINGRDVEGYAGPPRMACRRYLDNDAKGWPSETLLRARLESAGRISETTSDRPS